MHENRQNPSENAKIKNEISEIEISEQKSEPKSEKSHTQTISFVVNGKKTLQNVLKIKDTKYTYFTDGTPIPNPPEEIVEIAETEEIKKSETETDSNGKITKKIEDGFFFFYEYNEHGELISILRSKTDAAEEWDEKTEFEFDDEGREIREVSKNRAGEEKHSVFTEYSAEGKKVHAIQKDERGKIESEEWTIFDEKENTIYKKIANGYEIREEINEYQYEDEKTTFQKKYEKRSFSTPAGWREWERTTLTKFGENGSFRSKIKETKAGDGSHEYEIVALYDENGRAIYEKNPRGSPDGFEKWSEYDSHGNVTYIRESLGERGRETFIKYTYYFSGLVKRKIVYEGVPSKPE